MKAVPENGTVLLETSLRGVFFEATGVFWRVATGVFVNNLGEHQLDDVEHFLTKSLIFFGGDRDRKRLRASHLTQAVAKLGCNQGR